MSLSCCVLAVIAWVASPVRPTDVLVHGREGLGDHVGTLDELCLGAGDLLSQPLADGLGTLAESIGSIRNLAVRCGQ